MNHTKLHPQKLRLAGEATSDPYHIETILLKVLIKMI